MNGGTMRHALRALAVAGGLLLAVSPGYAGDVAVPDGYRMSNYRAPVPDEVPGATTIDVETANRMLAAGEAVFIDVIPAPPRPAGRADWNPPTRRSLPGAHWLPNVGRGAIPASTDAYYRDQLRRLTGGAKDRPLVVFCKRNCWMSWNAAKRALEYGYRNVYWYPNGTDAWRESGRELRPLRPEGEVPR